MPKKLPRKAPLKDIVILLVTEGFTDDEVYRKCTGKEMRTRFYNLRDATKPQLKFLINRVRGLYKEVKQGKHKNR